MLLRPDVDDLRLISFYLGRIVYVVGGAALIPFVWALTHQEWAPAATLLFTSGLALLIGGASSRFRPDDHHMDWNHGMVVVALAWLIVPLIGAIPLYLSGHYGSALDAYFDAMSGVTTTGLGLIQDLDHLSTSINVWRSTLQFLGGQGIVLAALTFFAGSGILALYHAEARDEKIFPSVASTARFIWLVSLFHAFFGIAALWLVGIFWLGFNPGRALFHGFTVFMSAFDTGGFAPMSTSISYYHSFPFEAVVSILMVAGAFSFGLHHTLWKGPRRQVLRNLETRTFAVTVAVTMSVAIVGLATDRVFSGLGLLRHGFFQLISAHTGTGFATLSPLDLSRWQGLAFAGFATAMALGGMASSTAGGVKSLRIGLTIRSLANAVKEVLLPEHSVVRDTYFQNGTRTLGPDLVRSVMAVSLLYVGLYLFGAAVGIAYGYPLQEALFESVSAGASVGLSVGVTNPAMPTMLKVVYILQMWAGRLEFIAAFALAGFLVSWIRGE